MKYLNRQIESQLQRAVKQFSVVALTGPRQAGKSTLLQHLFPEYAFFTFDDPVLRKRAKDDPGLFMQNVPAHSVLDEVQYVPELLPYIKIRVDRSRGEKGQFLLTGSQIFHLMAGLTETLAGRVAIFELLPFSYHELNHNDPVQLNELFHFLFRGFYPDPSIHDVDPKLFYGSYVQTYLERDIRQITTVQDLNLFQHFVELLAARAGGILNLSEVSRDSGVSHTTAQKWLSLLETSRIIYLLRPFFKNISKRVIKSPKLYFTDTGLLAYLLKYPDPATLLSGPMAGNLFENFLIVDFLKEKFHGTGVFDLYFYRDTNKNEIDLIIEEATRLHLVEIKMRMNVSSADTATMDRFAWQGKKVSRWLVSCFEHDLMLSSTTRNVPWWLRRSILPT
jgi:hypothetical protein